MIYLTVAFAGAVDLISKKDIYQYTVDLKFQTKRVTSKVFGYISKTDSSLSTDLHLDYKFLSSKEQRVSWKLSLANRSRKNLAIFIGACNVQSTAYPTFNFYSNATFQVRSFHQNPLIKSDLKIFTLFQRSGSHMEFKVGLIQNPLPLNDPKSDSESLKFDFIFSHKAFTDSRQTIRAIANVKRKSSDLDLKGLLLYESINSDIKLEGSVNYAKNKQASVTAFWSHPRTTLEYIKADLNVTLPTFTPMTLSVEVNEVHNREYKVKQPKIFCL